MTALEHPLDVDRLIDNLNAVPRIPDATYRLQLNESFTFRDALALVPYLHDLGISHVYLSPIFKSRSGSTHGYDVCDHSQFSPALGTAEDFDAFSAALHERGIGIILDTVPNHMGIGDPCNTWWLDVLENGPASIYAAYFDIDWQPVKPELHDKVLIPILEDQYGVVLEDGKLKLMYEEGGFCVAYYNLKLPIAADTYRLILEDQVVPLQAQLGEAHEHVLEFQSILTALSHLPPRTLLDIAAQSERHREKDVIKRRLGTLLDASLEVCAAVENGLAHLNGTPGDPHSFDRLDTLLSMQSYRPAYWRVAAEEINYRRFFDINDLAAIRVELPQVFEDTHRLIFKLLGEGKINGLRIDHPDGLWNPAQYFRRLQEGYIAALLQTQGLDLDQSRVAAAEWFTGHPESDLPLYVIVEKILSKTEPLPSDWLASGTTGYDFMNAVNGIFVDRDNNKPFTEIYRRFVKTQQSFAELAEHSKAMIMQIALASEINTLSHAFERINEKQRRYRDFTLSGISHALREVIANLGIYRTYITGPGTVSERDEQYINAAIWRAKRRNPRIARTIFDFMRDTLLLRNLHEFADADQQNLLNFVMKFQQVTGPVMAKSLEDTAFYVFNRLVSLNEVGGEPEHFGTSLDDFHRQNAEHHQYWPHTMLSTSTHDTKRSEDVRARIDVLSEIPGEWNAALSRWKRLNAMHRTGTGDEAMPGRNEEYLFYQILLGAWPIEPYSPEEFDQFRERIAAYMLKAAKEAKIHTSWINPDSEYDAALQKFVQGTLSDKSNSHFLEDITRFQHRIAFLGRFNSLSQQVLKLTSPGVPDVYQGTELWDLSLVDPDNRRPVDYERRKVFLSDLKVRTSADPNCIMLARTLVENAADGRIKLYVIHQILAYRREHAELFCEGDYQPLPVTGDKVRNLCAFSRHLKNQIIIVAVPRLVLGLVNGIEQPPIGAEVWGNTRLTVPAGNYRNLFTGESISTDEQSLEAAALFAHFPAAVLVTER
jgi:(1->4)-alpha-D-glucan 1-alpha-D-glucosylmutase